MYEDTTLTNKALKVIDGLEVNKDNIHVWKASMPDESKKRRRDSESPDSKRTKTDAQVNFQSAEELTSIMQRDAPNKQARELYVGNVPDQYDPEELRSFLGEAMRQSGLALYPGNPILNLRINQKFCFLEVRTIKEATLALNLTNIIYKGCSLQFGRTKTYTGSTTAHKTWDEVRGSCTLGVADSIDSKYESIVQALRPLSTELTTATSIAKAQYARLFTKYLQINNITTIDQVQDPEYMEWLEQDIKSKLIEFGKVVGLFIPSGKDAGKVFVEYENNIEAAKFFAVAPTLSYCGRLIGALFISQAKYEMYKDRNK